MNFNPLTTTWNINNHDKFDNGRLMSSENQHSQLVLQLPAIPLFCFLTYTFGPIFNFSILLICCQRGVALCFSRVATFQFIRYLQCLLPKWAFLFNFIISAHAPYAILPTQKMACAWSVFFKVVDFLIIWSYICPENICHFLPNSISV